MYTKEELGFILYNNRSVKGVVKNFLPIFDPVKLFKIEKQLDKSKSKFEHDDRMVEVNQKELDLNSSDIIVLPEELYNLTDKFYELCGSLSQQEYDYLEKRGFGEKTILDWGLIGLSNFSDKRELEIIGASCHPLLSKILNDGIENGGIIIPLFENNTLKNCAIRKINSSKSLKYSLACPDIPVWGISDIKQNTDIWITEGIFDTIALHNLGKKSVSCSSAMWTSLQLIQVLEKNPNSITIFSDKDTVGLRVSAILKDFFESFNIETKIVVSPIAKDPAEHYFQKNQTLTNLVEIDVTLQMLENNKDESYNFIEYLKNRKFN